MDSSSRVIQECKCRWKCVPYDGPPQASFSSVCSHEDTDEDLAYRVPFPTSATLQQVPLQDQGAQTWGPSGISLQRPSLTWPTLPASPNKQEQAHKQLSCSTNALQHPDMPSVSHSLGFSLWVLSKPTDVWYPYTLPQIFCFSSPWWASPSTQDGVDIATVKWRKVVKLFYARCAAVNLGWQDAHSGWFLCPVQ